MSTEPPFDFQHYLEWRRTPAGRAWWRWAVSEHHNLYLCDRCGHELWWPKGEGAFDEISCPYPCDGVLRKQKPREFWEQERRDGGEE